MHGFFKNPGLKILALLIAVAMWMLVAGEEEGVRTFSVPLDLAPSRDRVLAVEAPASVRVRMRGSESVLRRLSTDDLSVPVDLTAMPVGERTIQELTPRSVRGVPSGVAVESITPERLTLMVEPKRTRSIGIVPRLEGSPPTGYVLDGFQAEPDHVAVDGPEGLVSQTTAVRTEPILLQTHTATFSLLVGATTEDPRIHIIDPHPIRLTIRIRKEDKPR